MKESFIAFAFCMNTLAFSQPIDSIVNQVVENSLQITSIKRQHLSASERATQVRTHASPTVSVGVGVLPPETRLGAKVLSVGVQQFFPWLGTLKVRAEREKLMAENYHLAAKGIELEVVAKAKIAYYNMSLLVKKRQIIQNYIRILDALLRISKVHVETGKSLSSDVLLIQVQLQDLVYKLAVLQNERSIYQAQINELRNRPLDDSIWVVPVFAENVALIKNMDGKPLDVILARQPALLQLDNEIISSQLAQRINRKEGMPRIGLGLQYQAVRERVDANPIDNGRDVFIPKLSFSLPLYRSKYKAKHREELLRQQSIYAKKQHKLNQMRYTIHILQEKYSELLMGIRLLKNQVRTTESAYNVLMSFYSSRGGRFDELLETQRQLIQYELKLIEAYVQTHILRAQFDVLLFL